MILDNCSVGEESACFSSSYSRTSG